MFSNWSPHARYRLYTSLASYTLPLSRAGHGIREFENEICTRFSVAAAVCVPMARMGIFLVLKEVIQPGQKVVLSPLTIVDVVNAVVLAGGIPVFADINRRTCALDIDKVEPLLDRSIGAVLLTHLHGEAGDAHAFRALCEKRGIALIEDSAQACGGMENGKRLGTIGNAGIYSFGFYKNLTAWRGGMVVSDDTALIERIQRRVRELPRLPQSRLLLQMLAGLSVDAATHPAVFAPITSAMVRRGVRMLDQRLDPEHGAIRLAEVPEQWQYRMRDSQAQLALRRLDRLDQEAYRRIDNAALYHDGLVDQPVLTPERRGGLSNVYSYFPIQVPDRAELLRYARAKHRDFAAQHLRNCVDLDMFSEFYRDCPNARQAADELVLLPTYPRYPASEAQKNIAVIRQFFREQSDGRSKTTADGISRARAFSSRSAAAGGQS
jgi:perosamine synthetase